MADAFQIAQNALLDTSHAFGPDGKLTKQAQQMVVSYVTGTPGLAKMTGVSGAFLAASGASYVMSRPELKSVSQVNQAMDAMTQIMTGGPAGMATLFGMLGGTPTTVSHGGRKIQAPPAVEAMAKALASFTTPGGASAWNSFAGSQGFIAAEQQNLDQLRTYMTIGALGQRGAAGIAGFQLQQLLPMARHSPAALAMVMQQAAQMGIGGYYQGGPGDLSKNYAALQKSLGASAFGPGGLTKAMNEAVIKASNIPVIASQFMQGVHANLQSRQIAAASTDIMTLKGAAGRGQVASGALGDMVAQFRAQGLTIGHGLVASIDSALKQAGIGKAMRIRIEAQVTGLDKLNQLKDKQVHAKVNVEGAAQLQSLQNKINALSSKEVRAIAKAQGAAAVAALNAEIAALHSKQVTITTRMITVGGMAGVTPGIPAGVRAPGMQTGGLVPGSGSGDIIPAMLEPGEVVIPRSLVPLIAPILTAHRVPGFGGMPQSAASHFAAGGIVPSGSVAGINQQLHSAYKTLDALYAREDAATGAALARIKAQVSRFWKDVLDPLYAARDRLEGKGHHGSAHHAAAVNTAAAKDFAFTLSGEIAKEIKNTGAAKNIAQALVNKIGQEIQYAKQISSGVRSGLNLAGMDLTQGGVLGQMQNYAISAAAFGKDLTALRKGHLNKELISQIIGAGPVQGDMLAQSILGGPGGIGAVNKLYAQIGHSANIIGAQGAMAQYGGMLAPNLKSGTFTSNHVTVNINAGHGATLSLTEAQIKALVAKIQAELLKQAKRNPRTGLQLSGKGA